MTELTLALVLFLLPLAWSPGPGNLFFAANGARFGFRATLPANAGYHVATWVVAMAVGFGFLAAANRFPALFPALKVVGALYVGWIAIRLFQAGSSQDGAEARSARFSDGVVLLCLNPKAYAIMVVLYAKFLAGPDNTAPASVIAIATIFTLNNLVAFTAWTLAGEQIGRLFRTETGTANLNRIFGLLLGGVAVWMLVT